MITLNFLFYIFIVLFAIIGAMRGWAKELLVSFSVILAIFIILVLEKWVQPLNVLFSGDGNGANVQFVSKTLIVVLFAFFGYQTPNLPGIGKKMVRERLQDTLLGIFLGALNGYLIIGTIWYFLHEAGYPFEAVVSPEALPPGYEAVKEAVNEIVNVLPPRWLGEPTIYFAVIVAFAFIVIVFL